MGTDTIFQNENCLFEERAVVAPMPGHPFKK
jgi:hypothetical protein